MPILRIIQEDFQRPQSKRGSAIKREVTGSEVGKHHTALTSTCDENIQTAFTPFMIQGAKILAQASKLIEAITNTQENDVPFIPLDCLKILDKEMLVPSARKKVLHLRVSTSLQLYFIVDGLLLLHTKSPDSKTFVVKLTVVFRHCMGNSFRLLTIDRAMSSVVNRLG